MISDIERYINKIKNPVKKEYAKQYYLYTIGKSEKPTCPPAIEGHAMAYQAVRMEIDSRVVQL